MLVYESRTVRKMRKWKWTRIQIGEVRIWRAMMAERGKEKDRKLFKQRKGHLWKAGADGEESGDEEEDCEGLQKHIHENINSWDGDRKEDQRNKSYGTWRRG